MQTLTESLQVLTDEEKQQVTAQQIQQKHLNWLIRQNELQQEASRRQQAQHQAEAEIEKAQPQLAALELAQPAMQLRPQWQRIQEHTAAVTRTRQQSEEVNTRLQQMLAQRAGIRRSAKKQMNAMLSTRQTLSDWLATNDAFRLMSNELAGWRALFAQQTNDHSQQQKWQQQLTSDTRKLESLPVPTLNLSPDETNAALALYNQQRPLRQRLSTLHGQITPKQKRLAQLQASTQELHQQLTQRNVMLEEMRKRYKVKNQEFNDVKTICEQEARIKSLEAQRALLQSGQPCPLCGSTTHPAVAA